jgi:hypothetical protein
MNLRQMYESKHDSFAAYEENGKTYFTGFYVKWLERRLKEEIKWGHRQCTHDNCESSGTDCPASASNDASAVSR